VSKISYLNHGLLCMKRAYRRVLQDDLKKKLEFNPFLRSSDSGTKK